VGDASISSVEYYYCTVRDQPGEAAQLLSLLSESGVALVGFSIVPTGLMQTQLALFPEAPNQLRQVAKRANLDLTGPQHALLVQGGNELGALVDIHAALAEANISVYAANGVVAAENSFGYIIYVRPEDFKRAVKRLSIADAPSSISSSIPGPPPPSR